jgi:hypothetical protein
MQLTDAKERPAADPEHDRKGEELLTMASLRISLAATPTPRTRESLKKRTGHLFAPSSDERCTAWIFLAATGVAERCRHRRRQETFCWRHFRDRFDPGGV